MSEEAKIQNWWNLMSGGLSKELAAATLKERVDAAKAKGEPLSESDQAALDAAIKAGDFIPTDVAKEAPAKMIERGLIQAELKRQEPIVASLDELARYVRDVVRVAQKPAWDDFQAKRAAVKQFDEYRTAFDKAAEDARKLIGRSGDHDFREAALGHISGLKKRLEEKLAEE